MKQTILAFLNLLKNKAISIGILLASMYLYKNLPENQPLPFAELLYAVILVLSVSVLSPIMRLLVFPEVSRYAESGAMEKELDAGFKTQWLSHYRIATIICYATSVLTVGSLLGG
jgi:hypothetical protein